MIHHNTLEANIVLHCNNRCAACNHGSPFHKKYDMSAETLARDLNSITRFFHSDEFWFVGGEPLLHPDIPAMAEGVRVSKIADKLCVLTNGRLLDRMKDDFWNCVDMVRISVYPNLDASMVEFAREKAAKHGVQFAAVPMPSFFKIFGKPDPQENFKKCTYKNCCWTVHEGFFYLCPESAFFPDTYMKLPNLKEGCPIDASLTEEMLSNYIHRTTPFTACQICDPLTEQMKWHEVSSQEEFVKDSSRTTQ
jgi:cyclic pyranopterin phosphate synthase